MSLEVVSTLSEQVRSTKSRPYRMSRRAELVDETRQRITEAAVRLHTTVGPANTSISTVAEAAGVTRLTVYRHFPDLDHLFFACTAHWFALHPPPDPEAWRAVPELAARARRAFAELYGWYGQNADDLFPINRDEAAIPREAAERRRATSAAYVAALVDGHAPAGVGGHGLRAIAGHLTSFWTWRSLVVEQGLTTDEAVDLAVLMLTDTASRLTLASTRQRPSGGSR
jgi:AcrR family transcriptional regulator